MDEEASIILGDAIAFCQRDGQDARLINMLGQSRAVSLTEDTLTIEAPSRFAIAQLKKHQPTIEAYLEDIAFAPIALNIVAPQGASANTAPVTHPVATATTAATTAPEPRRDDVSRETMAPQPTASVAPAAEPAPSPIPTATHMPVAHEATPGEESGIAIKNTLSADDFRRMMTQMNGRPPAKSASSSAAPAASSTATRRSREKRGRGTPRSEFEIHV